MPPSLPARVTLVEVGPRDGLQNEATQLSIAQRVALCDQLTKAGIAALEVGAFVSPRRIPAMADSAAVFQGITRRPGVIYSALVPNLRGFEAAIHAGADEIVVFSAASETFCQRNIECSIAESIKRFQPVAAAARRHGVRLRGSISCALGCPEEGPVSPQAVAEVIRQFDDLGCTMIDLADTIGVGRPTQTMTVLDAALKIIPADRLAGHFHDTYGMAIANIWVCLERGISHFHSSVAGLGGCPYARGARGNVATEDVLYLLSGLGIATDIDLPAIVSTGHWVAGLLGHPVSSRVGQAYAARVA